MLNPMTIKKNIGVWAGSCNDGKTVIGIETWEGVDDIIGVKSPMRQWRGLKSFQSNIYGIKLL